MQQVSVWLVGPVQPGHSEMLFGCRFAHTGFHFYCLCTHPEHTCSHHQSQALEKRVISAYHGSLAPGTSLHPARQAPSLEQPTNQLELASGEPGSAPTQPTKRTRNEPNKGTPSALDKGRQPINRVLHVFGLATGSLAP